VLISANCCKYGVNAVVLLLLLAYLHVALHSAEPPPPQLTHKAHLLIAAVGLTRSTAKGCKGIMKTRTAQ
jgi:hypothetical protein